MLKLRDLVIEKAKKTPVISLSEEASNYYFPLEFLAQSQLYKSFSGRRI